MHRIGLALVFMLGVSVINTQVHAQETVGANLCFSKGGLGITYQGVYIDVKSDNNQLRLNQGQTWVGASRTTTEVVLIQNGQVVESPKNLKDFDLAKCLVISFQSDRVLFFDFPKSKGGYYLRIKE